MPLPSTSPVRRAGEADRPLLSRLAQEWFRTNIPVAGWLAGSGERAEAGVMLAETGSSTLHVELAGVSTEALDRWTTPLLEAATTEARRCGARNLDAWVTSLASRAHGDRLEGFGFEVFETFDEYEVELGWLIERIRKVREMIDRGITSRVDARIEEVDAHHLDAVAAAWSAWIGGPVDRGIQSLRQRFHQARPGSPDRRLRLVAIQDDTVVGFAAGHLEDPSILKIEAEAVHPTFRLDPFFSDLTRRFYETASELGATSARFEAGSRQPNTVAFTRRWKVAAIRSQRHFRLDLGVDGSTREG